MIGISVDITDRKRLEDQLAHQALHDALTGLPNRVLFLDRTTHSVGRARRYGQTLGVVFLDLDNFKLVNDSLGHEIGDRLLVTMAGRLMSCLRDVADLSVLAGQIIEAVSEPVVFGSHEIFVTPSIGIVITDSQSATADALLRDADVAMYRAKQSGKGRYAHFEPEMGQQIARRMEMESDLRRAIDRDKLELFYQPIVDVATGSLQGFEALIRWRHPGNGIISPGEFIPLAEETGLIVPIGRWVVADALQHRRSWQETWPNLDLSVSVNLSARQLSDSLLVDDIAAAIAATGVNPFDVVLEITESVMMEDAELALSVSQQLKQLGVRLAVDDFGTGFSSLGSLRRFTVDKLKIDRSFIDGLGREDDDTVIVSGVIGLAHGLGLMVVAEGVETAEQLEALRQLGCDRAQGYYFARPMPAAETIEYIEREYSRQQIQSASAASGTAFSGRVVESPVVSHIAPSGRFAAG